MVCEPLYHFHLEVPTDTFGHVLGSLARLRAVPQTPSMHGSSYVFEGEIPAASVRQFQQRLPGLTHGEGVRNVPSAVMSQSTMKARPARERTTTCSTARSTLCTLWGGRAQKDSMSAKKMHANEVHIDAALVHRLLAGQFSQWADLPISPVKSYGTDHDIHRLGDHLPLALPVQVAMGQPTEGYPFDWSVYRWMPGENANGTIDDLDQAAVDLAAFVKALRQVDTTGAHPRPPHGRGGPLAEGDEQVRRSVAQLGDRIDGEATLRSWEASLRASAWDGLEVWVHGDLLPGNLLVVDGRLSAVIDWGGLNVGDLACDLQPAWNVFAGDSRRWFRAELEVDDASWLRDRGWALYQAVSALAYYWDTNPGMIRQASHALTQVLADSPLSGPFLCVR